jgi:hypothetical protein
MKTGSQQNRSIDICILEKQGTYQFQFLLPHHPKLGENWRLHFFDTAYPIEANYDPISESG